ncbi:MULTISPECIES: type VII toxin-antitoxin system MntA family adenylyltransferase antitoxin [unclassified Pseudomonas]|jgi:predicted nucleotidyltransferase|uniref:type VII toxin-antitoxin system MntA family adenylyltransferase antitoxin n=1 Tax=unclassified Pseudomonas TaxID=196821 RepID=UPI000B404B46|nr:MULTISPECIES: nucleotidyltransferase domain-containing protein [unclassified Pseudomonas]AUO21819.1 nucleotidyltransferase domain-containing protein [Pseudomonas sp. NC02]MBT1267163.1 nucleotidyltransferase domain-containing protein [Pseudomonas sp. VS38]MDQ0666339.1 putative nucleotidyltransferase [Pseudomonas sp. W2I6]NVZ14535.1 nucleotidyltransferase domain-containing protein [Pseudomonas sp. IPO3775]NVZ31166.1 nucleotidyltransferase domain-containing protein [Pseudomonas sp. A4002]
MNFKKVLAHLQAEVPELLAVYVFGSQVTGEAGSESDLDVAVLSAGVVEPLLLWQLSGELADIVGVPVDLLDLRAASTVMQYQVLTTGRRLWSGNVQAGLFESYVLSEKTALDTARAELLADIQKEGKVYGR